MVTLRPTELRRSDADPSSEMMTELRLPLVIQIHRRGIRISIERSNTPVDADPTCDTDQLTTDRVLRTVLMTDVVDSTGHVVAAGDGAWRATLDLHDELVRDQLGRFSGSEVKVLGDGFLAVFDAPCRAIACAHAIAAGARRLGLRIRAGVHTGEVERRGLDVAGLAVHIGARITALAGPDEVLVSGTVPPLVMGSGLTFRDRGEHQLRGLPGQWRLYAAECGAALAQRPRNAALGA